jgi:hypothetical protein
MSHLFDIGRITRRTALRARRRMAALVAGRCEPLRGEEVPDIA